MLLPKYSQIWYTQIVNSPKLHWRTGSLLCGSRFQHAGERHLKPGLARVGLG
jgi:hypothetical protein